MDKERLEIEVMERKDASKGRRNCGGSIESGGERIEKNVK